ncbi:AmmeMemoRadiSam system radical SAM enzyme [Desulfonatronovibrio hydrogenovorans]|uniref:AmmeMemoRadiSam system radical SAM enzyme n=1 Tax=Desulfonatronovibrio hydrogenovorans TaxID=53245 RepID=UPI000491D782|nr:AmmeMemoRadiSam system radical SAM enzyme [Desulfonatronovibrio hydrogenovorans]
MSDSNQNPSHITRKEFIQAGVAGLCGLGLAGWPSWSGTVLAAQPGPAQTAAKGLVSPTPSPWFKPAGNNRIQCRLCPNQCTLANNQRSRCQVRENRNGRGYTLAFGNPALIQEDPVERKPFFHVLPGTRALSVSTAGCNLHCKFCQVWDMALVRPEQIHAYDLPPEAVVDHALSAGVDSLSYAFGEPVVFFEYMTRTAELARQAGLLNLVHTAGYIRVEPLEKMCSLVDAANIDLKGFDPDFYREYVGGELDTVLNTLVTLKKAGVHVEITCIIIPTINDDPGRISRMCSWISRELGPDTPVHFARFYPLYKLSGLPRTPVSTLDMAVDKAGEAGLKYVYVAKVTGHEKESTFCPECREKIISRLGFFIDQIKVTRGQCSFCSTEIPGIWAGQG